MGEPDTLMADHVSQDVICASCADPNSILVPPGYDGLLVWECSNAHKNVIDMRPPGSVTPGATLEKTEG